VVDGQLAAGADYLDLNVDEVSLDLDEQVQSMRWLVRMVQSWTTTPVAIDSPNTVIIAGGVEQALQGSSTPPMVNSASMERLGALDLAVSAGAPVIVTAAGESSMPKDDDGRVENAGRMVELAVARGIPLESIYIDPLVFPISVDSNSGGHCLAAIRRLRERYGPDIHITGGFSNVSFGLPNRRLVNEAFLMLAIDAGADSGIIDPVATSVSHALAFDKSSRPYQLAVDTLTGRDSGCRRYLSAHRAGELSAMS
jgi:cobalamin-dependent methionine synthase I